MLATDWEPMEVIDRHIQSAPVDVHAIVDELGLRLVYADMGDNSGKIERHPWVSGGFAITVNSRHSTNRQRFTIAHEIGHFMLHRDLIGDGIVDDGLYRSRKSDQIERQANTYAASLLMPAPMVRQKFREGVLSYAAMGRAFEVSSQVAEIRMKGLRLG